MSYLESFAGRMSTGRSRKEVHLPFDETSVLLTLETMKCYGYVRHGLNHKMCIYLCLVITFTYDDIYEILIVSARCSLPHLCLFYNERLVPGVSVQYCIHFQLFTSLLALVWRKELQQSTAIRTHLTFIKL